MLITSARRYWVGGGARRLAGQRSARARSSVCAPGAPSSRSRPSRPSPAGSGSAGVRRQSVSHHARGRRTHQVVHELVALRPAGADAQQPSVSSLRTEARADTEAPTERGEGRRERADARVVALDRLDLERALLGLLAVVALRQRHAQVGRERVRRRVVGEVLLGKQAATGQREVEICQAEVS